jgi:predicted dehydrogenase
VNVAMVGTGGMGLENARGLLKHGQRIVALADVDFGYVDRSLADRARNPRTGEVNPDFVAVQQAYAKATRHADYRKMLEREKGIDGVVIATPDHMHAFAAKAAMELGKHVYVQKPLTYSVHEARVLRATAVRTGVVTQMGNQGHSNPEAQLINEWVRKGALGPVREVHVWTDRPIWPQGLARPAAPKPPAGGPQRPPFGNPYTSRSIAEQTAAAMTAGGSAPPPTLDWNLYLGASPDLPYHPVYHPFNWRGWTHFGVGALGDMGAHLIDHPYWALGLTYPTSIEATSTPWGGDQEHPDSYPQSMTVHYEFAARGEQPPVRLSWYDGGVMPPRPAALPDSVQLDRGGGVLIVGDKGVLMHETYGLRPRIYPESLFASVAPDYVREVGREEEAAFRRRLQQQDQRAQAGAGAGGSTGAQAASRATPAAVTASTAPVQGGLAAVLPPRPGQSATQQVTRQGERPDGMHELNWVDAIRNHRKAICPLEYAAPLTETMLLGIVALRTGQGKKIYYDGETMAVVNAPESNQYLTREYRAGWSL